MGFVLGAASSGAAIQQSNLPKELRRLLAANDAGSLSEQQTTSALRDLLLQVPETSPSELRRRRDDDLRAYVSTWCADLPSGRKKATQLRRDLAIYEAGEGRSHLVHSVPPEDLDARRAALFWLLKYETGVPRSRESIRKILCGAKPVSGHRRR